MFPHQEEALGKTRIRWDKVFGLAWVCLSVLPEELEKVIGRREVCLDYRWMDGPPLKRLKILLDEDDFKITVRKSEAAW